jgi:hypothetical protein
VNEQLCCLYAATTDDTGQHQFADGVNPCPDPPHCPAFLLALTFRILSAEQSPQFIYLDLTQMQVMDQIVRDGFHVLGGLVQPHLNGVGIHVKDAGGRADVQAFC